MRYYDILHECIHAVFRTLCQLTFLVMSEFSSFRVIVSLCGIVGMVRLFDVCLLGYEAGSQSSFLAFNNVI